MKVLYVASEAVPFCKTGGLADVAGSLPKALKAQGIDVRVVIPKFSAIKEEFRNNMEHVYSGSVPVSWRTKFVGIDKYELDGVTYYFIDNTMTTPRDFRSSAARSSTALRLLIFGPTSLTPTIGMPL